MNAETPTPPRFLTAGEIAQRWRRSPRGVQKLIQRGELPGFRPSPAGPWLVSLEAIEQKEQSTATKKP